MDYEIVKLEERIVAGLTARTNNSAPDMGSVIGELWKRFYGEGIYERIMNKANQKALGIYSDYDSDAEGDYNVTVACEVTSAAELPEEIVLKKIPAGKYARFVVKGNMQQVVADFWEKLWEMDLDRSYLSDFEEYQNSDMEDAVIHLYIGVK